MKWQRQMELPHKISRMGCVALNWIDKQRTPCGGTHSWEDHKAALIKFGPPKGKGYPADKGGKGKGKGKGGKDQDHSLT